MVVDTSVFIEHLRAKDKSRTTLAQIPSQTFLAVSTITLFELYLGATTESKRRDVIEVTEEIHTFPFSEEIAQKAAEVFNQLKKKNQLIEFRDLFIASTALVYRLPIKTLNRNHYDRIDGLVVL